MSEKEIENGIITELKRMGLFVWKNNSIGVYDFKRGAYRTPGKFHLNGTADILGIFAARFLAIEVKSEKGKLTDDQRQFLTRINQEGGIAFVTRSLENCFEQLQKFDPDNKYIKHFLASRGHDQTKPN